MGQLAARLGVGEATLRPATLLVGITNTCNLRCDGCFHAGSSVPPQQRRARGIMRPGLFERIVDQARDFVGYLELSPFGEATLHPELVPMLRYATRAGLSVGLVTNGTRLTQPLCEQLIELGLSTINVSMDGTSPEEFERLRVGASWEQVEAGLGHLVRARARLGRSSPRLVVRALHPGAELDSERRQQTRRLLGVGIDQVLWTTPHNWSGSLISPQGSVETPSIPETTALCPYPWLMLVVTWDGTVVPCCADFEAKNKLANLEEQSLQQVWRGPDLDVLRRSLASRDRERIEAKTGCAGCSMLSRPTLAPGSTLQLARQAIGEHRQRLVDALREG